MKAAIIGFGVLGKQIKSFLLENTCGDLEFTIFDDTYSLQENISIFPFYYYLDASQFDNEFYIGVGYKHLELRAKIISELKVNGRKVKSLIHKSCYISPSAKIGDGCILFPGVNIDQNVVINDGCVLHNGVIISHDTIIGTSTYVSPGTVISGDVTIGNCCFLGTGSLVSNSVNIESNVQLGIGTVVTKNLNAGITVIGNPAITLSKKLIIK